MNFTDPYTFRARVQPALVAVLPIGLMLFVFLPEQPIFATAFFAILSAAGGTAVASQVGRDPGRKKEKALWESWGGPPTTRLLRHRRLPGDDALAPELRQQVEEWIGYSLPTKQEEDADPTQADMKYEQAVMSLITATRDTSKFSLVFAENVNYGFRRNLWGLKRIGAPIAVALVLISWTLVVLTIWGRPWPTPWWDILVDPDSTVVVRLVVAITDTAFAAFWLFWVKTSWVKIVAGAYAKRLMESVQTLRSG